MKRADATKTDPIGTGPEDERRSSALRAAKTPRACEFRGATVDPPRAAAVIDTNVVVSGLLTGEPTSPTAVVLDGMLRGRFTYLLSLGLGTQDSPAS